MSEEMPMLLRYSDSASKVDAVAVLPPAAVATVVLQISRPHCTARHSLPPDDDCRFQPPPMSRSEQRFGYGGDRSRNGGLLRRVAGSTSTSHSCWCGGWGCGGWGWGCCGCGCGLPIFPVTSGHVGFGTTMMFAAPSVKPKKRGWFASSRLYPHRHAIVWYPSHCTTSVDLE